MNLHFIFLASPKFRYIREINEPSKELKNLTKHGANDDIDDKPINMGAQSLPVIAPSESKTRKYFFVFFLNIFCVY